MERCNDDAIPYVRQDGVVSIVSYGNDGQYDNAYLIANLEKRFSGVPLTIKGSMSFNYIKSDSYMNGDKIATRIKSLNSDARLSSNFRSMLNGEMSVRYSHDWNDIEGSGMKNDIDDVCLTGKVLLKKGNWKGTVSLGYRLVADDSYSYDFFDFGFGLEYKIRKVSVKISAENLLNMNRMEWFRTISTPYYYAVEKYDKVPGYLLAGVIWNY